MSYARVLETGAYIYSDGEYMNFFDIKVPEDQINIFLAQLNDYNKSELEDRIIKGRELIRKNKIDLGD